MKLSIFHPNRFNQIILTKSGNCVEHGNKNYGKDAYDPYRKRSPIHVGYMIRMGFCGFASNFSIGLKLRLVIALFSYHNPLKTSGASDYDAPDVLEYKNPLIIKGFSIFEIF